MLLICRNICIKLWRNCIKSSKNFKYSNLFKKYNWKGINFPSKIDGLKTFEKNNPAIALNILWIKEKEICPPYISKNNGYCECK